MPRTLQAPKPEESAVLCSRVNQPWKFKSKYFWTCPGFSGTGDLESVNNSTFLLLSFSSAAPLREG